MARIKRRFKCEMLSMGPEFKHLYMLTRPVDGKRHAVAVGMVAGVDGENVVADRERTELGLNMIKWIGLVHKEAHAPFIIFSAHPRADLYCQIDSSDGLRLDGDRLIVPLGMFNKF